MDNQKTVDKWNNRLEEIEHNGPAMQWLSMEDDMRKGLADYKAGLLTAADTVRLMDNLLGGYTRRGHVLDFFTEVK